MVPNVAIDIRLPCFMSPDRADANNQAAATAKAGFKNSGRLTEIGPRPIQRRAPLISVPMTNVATTSRENIVRVTIAARKTPVGDSSDAPIIRASATGR